MGWGTGNIGGGSAGLNFKVVGGTTEPSNPSENMIWVNTDVKITGWCFSATEPNSVKDGMVWISVGTAGSVAFPATKKNPIMVYPISAKQYISGAWVDVEAKSYQNGVWVDWLTYLYYKGNEYADITGGWTTVKEGTNNSIAKTANGITLKANSNNAILAVTDSKVNLSNMKTLSVNITDAFATNAVIHVAFQVLSSKAQTLSPVSQLNMGKNTTWGELASDLVGKHTLNVSDLDGSYYVGLFLYGSNGISLTFDNIHMR